MTRKVQLILAAFCLSLYGVSGFVLTRYYRDAVACHCHKHSTEPSCAALVHGEGCVPTAGALAGKCSAAPSDENARFFAVQTISTTGYGSEVFLNVPKVQEIATYGMLAGPAFFALLISLVVSALATKRSRKERGPT